MSDPLPPYEKGQRVDVRRYIGLAPIRWESGFVVVDVTDDGWIEVKGAGVRGIVTAIDVRASE